MATRVFATRFRSRNSRSSHFDLLQGVLRCASSTSCRFGGVCFGASLERVCKEVNDKIESKSARAHLALPKKSRAKNRIDQAICILGSPKGARHVWAASLCSRGSSRADANADRRIAFVASEMAPCRSGCEPKKRARHLQASLGQN